MKLKTINTAEEFRQWIEAEDGTFLVDIRNEELNRFRQEDKQYIVLTPYFGGDDTQVYQIQAVEVQREEVTE